MIPGDLASKLRQLSESVVQPLAVIHKLPPNLPEFVAGQQFTAQIQNPLPDGSYQALVAGKMVTLALPHSVKSGDVLELIVTGQKDESVTARLATPHTAATEETAQSTLSQTGRLISQLLTGKLSAQQTPSLAKGEALLPESTANNPQQLASKLQQAVTHSGVFYESHVKAWAEGRMPLATLLNEPQAQFMQANKLASALQQIIANSVAGNATAHTGLQEASILSNGLAAGVEINPQNLIAGTLDTNTQGESEQSHTVNAEDSGITDAKGNVIDPSPNAQDEHGAQNGGVSKANDQLQSLQHNLQSGSAQQSAQGAQGRIPDALMPVLYQQLETMATHQMQWQFQAWPGMNVQWSLVDPDQEEGGSAAQGDEIKAWRSNLRLQLPNLGEIDAQLILSPQGLSIRLDTDNQATAQQMKLASQNLVDAMEASGISMNSLMVSQHASA